MYLHKPEAEKYFTDEILDNVIKSMFSTLTNVNFDKEDHVEILAKLAQHRDYIKHKLPADATLEHEDSPAAFVFRNDL